VSTTRQAPREAAADAALHTTDETSQPTALRRLETVGGRFISRGRLTLDALHWLAWLAFSPRSVVSTGVERELEWLGLGAVRLVTSASILVGLIATFQVAYQLTPLGAEAINAQAIGWFAARELGPLSVALLVVARSASAIAGELASMSADGETDALRAMGLDPVKYLVAPKVAALLVALPCLTILADALIVLGGWIGNVFFLGYNTNYYLGQFRDAFDLRDFVVGLGKSVIFAFVISIIASDEGLSVEPRVAAIGGAATRAVVFCMIGVLAADTLVNVVFYFIPRFI
jgi:phospholipid/cholesterol/gamma-HCH transport system permease protein